MIKLGSRTGRVALAGAAGLLLALGAATPALAAPTPPPPATPDTAAVAPPAPSGEPSLNMSDPAAVAKLAQIRATGATVIAATTVPYTPAPASASRVSPTPDSFPSGCGLNVFIYQTGLEIVATNQTSCLDPYEAAEMESYLYFETGFGNEELTSDTKASGANTSFAMDYTYTCVNHNTTTFLEETYGTVEINGDSYTAAAYDELDGAACGTS